jgi:hypothetical protein
MYKVGNSVEQVYGGSVIKQGDRTPFGFVFRDEAGENVSIKNATVKIKIANEKALLIEKNAVLKDDYVVEFSLGQADITGSGDMRLEFTVTYSNGLQEKFPSDDWQRIKITPTLDDITQTEIAYLTFEKMKADFTQKVDDLNKRVDNIVAEAGNSNIEIMESREDTAGNVYTTLKDRLVADIGYKSDFRYDDPDLITKMKNEFKERRINLNWYKPYATKDSTGKVIDWGPALKQIASESNATTNVSYGKGVSVLLSWGTYPINTTVDNINKSNFSIEGMGYGLTNITANLDDGSSLFKVECLDAGHLNYFRIADLTLAGNKKNSIGVYAKKASICTFDRIRVRDFANHGIYLEEVYDSYFYGISVTGCGKMSADNNQATSKHAVYIYNGANDNCNRLIFTACHFEANYGSHVYSDSTGNSRKNGQLKFIGCKFHGVDPTNLANCPATPHVYLDADISYLESCMFFQCNENFLVINGDRNKITACDFNNSTQNLIKIIGTSTENGIIGCGGLHYNGKAVEDISTGENFISSHFNGYSRKFSWGTKSIGDDGGRLALWFNMYRSTSKYQMLGDLPSFSVSTGSDGVDIQGAAASGTNNSVITPSSLLSVNLTRIRAGKPIQLIPTPVDVSIPNNSFFVDSSDGNKLKFKDNSGVVKLVNLT